MSSRPAAELIAAVARSPALCAAHDRAGWVGLFASDGEVNDPVGSRPHRGREAIERFYDTFIAPNRIAFDVEHDIVCGMSVVRDLTLTSTMSTGLAIPVPMHLRYDLVEEGGALKIRRLLAHWELPALLKQQLGSVKGWVTSMKLTPQLLRHQGFGGLLGFMRGLGGAGRGGKRTAEAFLEAASRGDGEAASALLRPGAGLEFANGPSLGAAEFINRLKGLRWRKVLAAGDYVTVTLELASQRGVGVFRFDRGPSLAGVQVFA